MEPVQFHEIKKGMRLWDNKNKRWAKVFYVYLWADILAEKPGRFFKKKPRKSVEEAPQS